MHDSPRRSGQQPRGAVAGASPTPTEYPYQYGFAREAFSALAATETYGLWVTLVPLRASERSLRCVWQAMGHAERLRRLVTMGVLVQLGMSLECCSEGASFWSCTPSRPHLERIFSSRVPCCPIPVIRVLYGIDCPQRTAFFLTS